MNTYTVTNPRFTLLLKRKKVLMLLPFYSFVKNPAEIALIFSFFEKTRAILL